MRILLVSHSGSGSTVARALFPLTQRVNGLEVSLLSPAGELREQAIQCGTECRLLNGLSVPAVLARIRHCVREWDADVIHALNIQSGVLAIAATTGMSIAIVSQLRPGTAVSRLLLALSARAHVASIGIPGKHKSDRVHVLDQAVDLVRFHPATRTDRRVDAGILRDRFGFSAGAFVIAMVAGITKNEGQLEVLRSFPAILAKVPRAVLVIAGTPLDKDDWEYRSRLDHAINSLELSGRVCLTGEPENMARFYRGTDVLIVNSASEPVGSPLLEGMACGRPVIAADVGIARKAIRSGNNGVLYGVGDYRELVRCVIGLAASAPNRDEMGARARESVTCQFTIDIQRIQLLAMYNHVLEKPNQLPSTGRLNNKPQDSASGTPIVK